MPQVVTEVAQLFLKEGEDPTKPGYAGDVWKDALESIRERAGSLRWYWGIEVENPLTFRLFIDWETLESHTSWMKSDNYPPRTLLRPILSGPPIVQHNTMTPNPPSAALTAPTTEIITAYFPTSLSSEGQAAAEAGFHALFKAVENDAAGYKGSAGGWSLEEAALPKEPATKGKVYVGLIGWESIEAHMAFRQTPEFKDAVVHLTGIKDMVDRSVTHVHCANAAQ